MNSGFFYGLPPYGAFDENHPASEIYHAFAHYRTIFQTPFKSAKFEPIRPVIFSPAELM